MVMLMVMFMLLLMMMMRMMMFHCFSNSPHPTSDGNAMFKA